MSKSNKWPVIGTVLGETNINEFSFTLKSHKASKGDIVCTQTKIPSDIDENKIIEVTVWGKITSIDSFNQFFPREAAQELTNENINIADTILPTTRDELICNVNILGYTKNTDQKLKLKPLNYPVKPAAMVTYPSEKDLEKLLVSDLDAKFPILLGNLSTRKNVKIQIDAEKLAARHMLVTGMSGAGKTVAVRRIISEYMKLNYPLLVIDIHGDYLGFVQKQKKYFKDNKVKLFYPKLSVNSDDKEIVYTLIEKLGKKLTDPQNDYLDTLISKNNYEGGDLSKYIEKLIIESNKIYKMRSTKTIDKTKSTYNQHKPASIYVVTRSLREVLKRLNKMEQTNYKHRKKMSDLKFEELPDPATEPEKIISKGQLSILYLKGYQSLPASAILSILMESLFNIRQEINEEICPFLTIIEEAQNFVPSRSENKDNLPSVETIRRIITEGRKFGTGICLVSQQPDRLDDTIISQCNSHIYLRLKNQKAQKFCRDTSEYADKEDTAQLPNLANGQAIICGQVVNFSLPVQIKFDEELLNDDIQNENFISMVKNWDDSSTVKLRKKFAKDFSSISSSDQRRPN